MSVLRFLMFFSLIVWLGGLIFFAFVLAPIVFSVLPTRDLAGSVVSASLTKMHWMALGSGVIFLISSMWHTRLATGVADPFAARHILVAIMLLLTLISQFAITPRMAALRASMGTIDERGVSDPARIQFNVLHAWSTRLEGGVMLLAVLVVYLTARQGP